MYLLKGRCYEITHINDTSLGSLPGLFGVKPLHSLTLERAGDDYSLPDAHNG